jgi:glycosyltransferase involved in cell wall biosynthesis
MSKRILWLASWYPSKVDPLTGDFIERHAKAASLFNDITVLFVMKDKEGANRKEIIHYGNNLRAWIYYYRSWGGIQYFALYRKLIKEYIHLYGKPDLVHVHVAFRAGLIGLYLKYQYRLKYIISEHWSLFNDAATPTFKEKTFLIQYFIKLIYRKSSFATAVSRHLSISIANKTGIKFPDVVPNVFDSSLFYPEKNNNSIFDFIHVSTLTPNKNIEQIVEAVTILSQLTTTPFKLIVFGPSSKFSNFQINKHYVECRDEVTQEQLAFFMRKQNALILYSRFENLPCVIIEANAAGLPVIVSDIPAMAEMVEDGKTGLIVPLNNPQLLAEKMLWMMCNYEKFSKEYINKKAYEQYNFNTVGKQFDEIYKRIS